MPNFLQWLAGNAQFLLLFLIFIVPMLGAALRWIETQRERRRRQVELERRRLEALRTGRVESPSSTPAAQPVPARISREELAARRQREMQERLRQRLEQQRRAGQPATVRTPTAPPRYPTSPPSTTRIPSPTARTPSPRPPIPAPTRQAPPSGRPFPQQQRSRDQRQPQKQARPPLISARPQQVPVSRSLQSSLGDSVAREEIGSSREAASMQTGGPVVRIGAGLSIQRLRDAVVLREVLDQPIALRAPDSDIFT